MFGLRKFCVSDTEGLYRVTSTSRTCNFKTEIAVQMKLASLVVIIIIIIIIYTFV